MGGCKQSSLTRHLSAGQVFSRAVTPSNPPGPLQYCHGNRYEHREWANDNQRVQSRGANDYADDAGGTAHVTTLDGLGRPVSTEVTGILPLISSYDTHGRLESVTQGSGTDARVTAFAYRSADGFLDYITDPMGHTVSFDEYDAAGRLKQETLPGSRVSLDSRGYYNYSATRNTLCGTMRFAQAVINGKEAC